MRDVREPVPHCRLPNAHGQRLLRRLHQSSRNRINRTHSHGDGGIRQFGIRVDLPDGRIVPLLDLAQEDVRQDFACKV
jgi:hypothetical protein